MAGTIVVDRIESDASYASNINVASQITFSNTVNFGITSVAPVAGFYSPSTNNVAFTTASTERMRISPSGNVLIGTTTTQTGAVLAVTGGIQGTITSGTAVASTSGTSIDFTSLPTWVKRITVMLNGVSTSGTSPMMVRFGVSGTPETTGYSSICIVYQSDTVSAGQSTAGWVFTVSAYITAAATVNGQIIFDLLGSNIWVCSGSLYREAGSNTAYIPTGSKTLAGTLNMVRLTTTGGTDTFDAGSVNILYEG